MTIEHVSGELVPAGPPPVPAKEAAGLSPAMLVAWVDDARDWLTDDATLADLEQLEREVIAFGVLVRRRDEYAQGVIDLETLRVEVTRKIGLAMKPLPKNPGSRKSRSAGGSDSTRQEDPPPTLAESGISKHAADDARKLAAIPDGDFEEAVEKGRANGHVTIAQVIRDASPEPDPDKLANLKPRHRIVEGHFIGMEWDLGLETTIKKANVKAHEAGQTLGDWLRQLVDEAVKQSNPRSVATKTRHPQNDECDGKNHPPSRVSKGLCSVCLKETKKS